MSKGLEALKRISKNSVFYDDDYKDYQAIEKELKALDFLIKLFKFKVTKKKKLISWVMEGAWFELEQKDYDVLKDVLL